MSLLVISYAIGQDLAAHVAFFSVGALLSAGIATYRNRKTTAAQPRFNRVIELENRVKALNAHSIVSVTDDNARIVDVNQKFIDTFGYTRDELIGAEASLIYAQANKDRFTKIRATLARGENWSGEVEHRAKSGRTVWTQTTIFPLLDRTGKHLSSISIRTDITATKQLQSEEDMRSTLHMLRDEVYVFDAETLRFSYLNKAAMKRFGWSELEYKTKTPYDANALFDRDRFLKRATTLIAGEVPQLVYTIDMGREALEISLQYVTNKEGRAQFVAFINNISERLELEKKKDDFISTVSHELRSPLTSIKGGIGLVLSGATGELAEKSRSLLEIAHRNSDRLVLIINDILDLEKIASGQMPFNFATTDMSALVRDAAVANESFCAQYQTKVRLGGCEQPVSVDCDPDRMFQVLNNLISNAAKYSHPGGEILVNIASGQDKTVLSVQDFGEGIPKDAQATIFDRFTQVAGHDRKAKGGTGLGLNIVKVIMENHDGTATLESAEGLGTTFTVCLPTRRTGLTIDA